MIVAGGVITGAGGVIIEARGVMTLVVTGVFGRKLTLVVESVGND